MSAHAVDGSCLLAGGTAGPAALSALLSAALDALATGAAERGGPLPGGGPDGVAADVRRTVGAAGRVLPERGTGPRESLDALVRAVARGAADPADPLCAGHLHCPPLALAVAAEVAASALNPSMDSWDQAPAASELESLVCRELAELVYGGRPAEPPAGAACAPGGPGAPGDPGRAPDALVTSGGTEANQLALLLAREAGFRRVVCGANAHHSVHRAAWLLGLEPPLVVPAERGVLDPAALDAVLRRSGGAAPLVVATAGTTDSGDVDPLEEIAALAARHGARWHVDAAYGGPLLFSERLRGRLAGTERADSVTFDLHKLGWQPVAAGLLAVPEARGLRALDHRADYLNADDDTDAGLPDLLGRSLRTTRRPDVLKVAVTLRALGRAGMAELVERTCEVAERFAGLVAADRRFELYADPPLSTVLFRPAGATDRTVALVRRRLLAEGRAVLGRAQLDGRLWLKATLLNPLARASDLSALLKLVADAVPHVPKGRSR
ncbi:pyridoxal phosphate-dependent decarboxylase family protein [Streptomyces boncukensis]|uniref:Aspartate aminotransferase family protein n=1 Tax=Streptomyces boncukensis TaxID=2711219 RepID=A0A6G4WUY8_9ACTN|nr:aminotransferase class V-fold PLP-dependent enzyme [Streptomyces boncukensis]NGO68440.1 aspartate aminotransferase family protein [Streptomyces boncukensis]